MSKQPGNGKRVQDNTNASDAFDDEDGDDVTLAAGPLEAAARALRDSMEFAGAIAKLRLRRMSEMPESLLEATKNASSDAAEALMLRIGEGGVLLGEQVSRAGAAISTSALRLVTEAAEGLDEAKATPSRPAKGGTQVVMAAAQTANERARSRPARRSPTSATTGVQRVGIKETVDEQGATRRRRVAAADAPSASARASATTTKGKAAPARVTSARKRPSAPPTTAVPEKAKSTPTTTAPTKTTPTPPAHTATVTGHAGHAPTAVPSDARTAQASASQSASSPSTPDAAAKRSDSAHSGPESSPASAAAAGHPPVPATPAAAASGSAENKREQHGDES